MPNSINTNYGASVALQNLAKTNSQLQTTQSRVSTGLKVATAKDNGAIFAVATTQRASMGAMDAVKNSLQRGQSLVDVALAAGDTVTSALEEMKQLAVNIQSSAAGSDSEASYLKDFNAMGKEVASALSGASFDGVNLWTTAGVTNVTTNTTGGTYGIGFAADTSSDATLTAINSGTVVRAGATTTAVDAAIKTVTTSLATLGTQSKSVGRQLTYVGKLQDATEAAIGNLVDADLAKESAKLTALQTKQQLGVQALSIANSSSSILLGLFR
ncbi:flagellin [Brevundimonas sp. SORGH_AS_0993]|uniref:flagellin n=1 Tax=Brevundimonas sp. SORGH_AS_0993 TaxID=3041794 RepID=UPI002784A9D4|nr:flagellin [Brevundimonas sp. SORGH_AS_0993]MDQ1154010.1 flagellin [Brevundimonas sp. SORGH_AS_0993]MDQ1154011.1 flagellin [Brevundimonas sp. SORGH_AS_0993]